jgi:hypothetical protein
MNIVKLARPETDRPETAQEVRKTMPRLPRVGSLAGIVGAIAAVLVLIVVLSAVHLLPQLRNPFAQTTTVRSEPVILKSITQLSRYEAASGSFEVVVDISKKTSLLPSFLAGSDTLFVGEGSDIAYVDFSQLKGHAITMNTDRTSVTVTLPKAQLEPAVLNPSQSYVYAEQQGLFNRVGNFFSGNPNSQQQVYILAQQKIQTAARQSPLLSEAQKNTQNMLTGMLTSLGFSRVTVTFGGAPAS